MQTEIERKFLVRDGGWQAQSVSRRSMRQAYLARTDAAAIRVRIVDDATAFLTIKSAQPGTTRQEFAYPIPLADAEALVTLRSGLVIRKVRHIVPAGALAWEVDVFEGALEGLVIAEIELPAADAVFDRPGWLGAEVTGDVRYYNSSLALYGLPVQTVATK